ncbi:5'-nucleotidase and phosphodiesterase protein, putative [Cryptosporidium muris RN66]|uniref:5'-nucleotidase and phosphodiesterase protein, putative n=1 Tax=Cryptosporidium muris (strain RN66) TaxID=441375 RepID=B6ACG9_CRYMR|nr:5'-nucleotidase and phosphodiesterase protein, putative [Cryptosporidium muris RN66]EEA05823.1 5'-nucleotidase and phosphodiesterase protein, putative [Cryptosporidium muris RN66]|eukprot:XP_002140172.1 5'-nucleotidase and phosphodiesterase protein [Cryptosporidium muris RN66]
MGDFLPFSSSESSLIEDRTIESVLENETMKKSSTVIMDGSSNKFRQFVSMGYTGETYYDYDTPFGPNDDICILHFNDVYNIEEGPDGMGGVARFVEALKSFHPANPLLLFSGDVFNPSIMSITTKGRHMVPFLNMMRVHTACFGNHDFDFGIDHLEYLTGSCNFPWLISNVYDAYTGEPLANGRSYRLFEWQGRRIGIMGLVERDWLKTLPTIVEDDVIYKDFVEEANRLSEILRSKDAELIIALTHMRAPNDERLAKEALDIDLILGGHDHEYYGVKQIGRTVVAKSGTDFRDLTMIIIKPGKTCLKYPASDTKLNFENSNYYQSSEIDMDELNNLSKLNDDKLIPNNKGHGELYLTRFCGGSIISWSYIDVSTFKLNKHVDRMVKKYVKDVEAQMDRIIGESAVQLETRFAIIRTSESNAGNWLTDIMRAATKTDIALLNSGTIRSDCVFNIGPIRNRDIMMMLPLVDPLVKLKVSGSILIQVLENSVSKWPSKEGRFLQVSGIKFRFNPDFPSGQRIIKESIEVQDINKNDEFVPLDINKTYTVVTKEFLYTGKDGFECLMDCELLSNPEDMPPLPTLVRNVFSLAAMANGYRKPHNVSTARKLKSFLSNPQLTRTGLSRITSKLPSHETTKLQLPTANLGSISISYPDETGNYCQTLADNIQDKDYVFMIQVSREGRIIREGNSTDPIIEAGLERVD